MAGQKEFIKGSGYHTHTLEAYKPESTEIPSRPLASERSAEDQPFYLPQKNVYNLKVHIDLSAGSYSLSTSKLTDLEELARLFVFLAGLLGYPLLPFERWGGNL